ncbi:TM0106 family RecB-like putative nuclease [Rhodococcus opacus]|uniref:TM0106 family RecB-like putative nuclease n=1 Tax=Rhodococcus opacus TaxID=37919 RepID=UPI000EA97851|nr:bifunctional RecB family nuclease/DEAD/DEAH box helicase [Rhodococcus opacus]QZS55232.1 TM0106 family RecB-like putative nuclease [Rhodococcus opacus]RKM71701.1 nuclease [Rhodococcus opacus]
MFLLDDTIVYSASDLSAAATCEFALLRRLDATLGLAGAGSATMSVDDDPMLKRTSSLGDAHEHRRLEQFRAEYGDGVVTMDRPEYTAVGLFEANLATVEAIRGGADVVYQGTFFDGRFLGFCDFLVRDGDTYAVHDTKLSRHAKVSALLQLAAYAEALADNGIPTSPDVHLLLGDDSDSAHSLGDIVPVYSARRSSLERILDEHRDEQSLAEWGDPRYTACGRCDTCTPEVEQHRDLLLVAGMRTTQRSRLIAAGIGTLDALAAHTGSVEGLPERTLESLRAQAALQLRQESSGIPEFQVYAPQALGGLPEPDDGDIFFDFEGDPLWAENGSTDWGLEYLFGVVEGPADAAVFRPFWAHDRAEERQALVDFLDYVTTRRQQYPNMHIYHYAAYEKSALLRLAGRHGVGEETVDTLLRDNVLVDLYPVVRGCLRIGERSYSIKKLEPLYMPEQPRDGDVTNAAASVVAYADYCDHRDNGREDEARALLQGIADYNEYDCDSTLRLRDWLIGQAETHGVALRPPGDGPTPVTEECTPTEAALREFAGHGPSEHREHDQQAAALMAAAVGYHRRERKPFWWAHFDRLVVPHDELSDIRDVLMVSSAVVEENWHKSSPRQRKLRRRLQLTGRFGTGSTVGPKTTMYALYDTPAPEAVAGDNPQQRGTCTVNVLDVGKDGRRRDVVIVEELLNGEEYVQLPTAITPGPPITTDRIESSIAVAADGMCSPLPALPLCASVDILRRSDPRTRSGNPLPPVDGTDYAGAITAALLDLDDSYVAVQGPPGTGKTYTGARVIKALVEQHHWRIGVVAQSHSVIENMLGGVVKAGLPAELVAKKDGRHRAATWTDISSNDYPGFIDQAEGTGCVIGGTAWDFANTDRVPPGSLDLLVIDEAGQFALANTIAVGGAARNLLLLGDPQQLPQVSQGTHPEPVDASALGWLAEGHGALPASRGYFLERTWRMHPELCAPVSTLSYDGKLRSQESASAARRLDGMEPGVHTVFVDHQGNATQSPEESREVVNRITKLLGSGWTDPSEFEGTRPLGESDILVVAPYNAQVGLIERDLAAVGLDKVEVGTVDKFQGREAAVAIVSMTASAIEDVPRGMSFLLSRNRMNVAVSRGKWAAIIIRSESLTRYMPSTPEGLTELGAFMRLTGQPKH